MPWTTPFIDITEFPLPESVFPSYLWEDDPMFDGEDEDLCCAVDEMEKTVAVWHKWKSKGIVNIN